MLYSRPQRFFAASLVSAPPQPEAIPVSRIPPLPWIAWALITAWGVAHALAPDAPPRAAWGLTTWEAWPDSMRWAAAVLLSVLALPPVIAVWGAAAARMGAPVATRDVPRSGRAVLAGVFAWLCWIGRSGNLHYGDGVVVAKIARAHASLLHYAGYNDGRATAEQVVEFALHRTVFDAVQALGRMTPYDTIGLTHAVCGGILVWLLTGMFATWWPGRGARQLAALGLFLCMGVIQLWFGHVETYTLGSTAFVGFLAAGSRTLQGKAGLARPALWAAGAMTLHAVFGGLVLGLAWLWHVRYRAAPRPVRARNAVWIVAPLVLAVVCIVLTYRNLGFSWEMIAGFLARDAGERPTFVPLWETTRLMERYTMFGGAHLLDMVNESLLTAPYAAVAIAGVVLARGVRPFRDGPLPGLLVAGTLLYLGVILVFNPNLGGRKDWDLFAPPAIGYGLLAILLLFRTLPDARVRGGIIAACTLAGLAHTVPWLVQNARIDLPRYIGHQFSGELAAAQGQTGTALLEYRQALAILPTPELATTCADLARKRGDLPGALRYYAQAIRWENRSELALFGGWEHALIASAEIHETLGDDAAARTAFEEAIALAARRHSAFPERAVAEAGLARIKQRAPAHPPDRAP